MNLDLEKAIECFVGTDFVGGCNQEEGKDPVLFLSRTGYAITYDNRPIIWVFQLQIEIALSTTDSKYIALSQAMRDVLLFVSLMKEIEFVIKLQVDTPMLLCSIFRKTSHSLRRQSRGDHTRSFSANATSHEAHSNQVSSLMEFCQRW